MEGYMLSVGYPIGVNTLKKIYEIETKNEIVELTVDEMRLWIDSISMKKSILSESDTNLAKEMIKSGAIKFASNLNDLFNELIENKPIRQGCFGIHDGKACISLGKQFFYPTIIQTIIWKQSDGEATVKEVFNDMSENLCLNDFMIQLIGLMIVELLFLR